jgi:hypothetical protein
MPLLGDEYKDKVPAYLLKSYKEEKLQKKELNRKYLKAEAKAKVKEEKK